MSVRSIEAEVSIKSGVQAECTIGREVIVEVHNDVNLEALTATANGSYRPASGVDGWDRVMVEVPERQPVTEPLSVTENGTYEPTEGIDGYDRVTVAVPPTIPDIESLTVTENGTYTASGDGYNPVIVNVQGYKIHTVTVEIGENTVSNALALYNYFLPYFEGAVALLGIVMQENTYTVNNQFASYLYGVDTGYEHRATRRRNNADNNFAWRGNNYDAYLVAGTHYTVTFVR